MGAIRKRGKNWQVDYRDRFGQRIRETLPTREEAKLRLAEGIIENRGHRIRSELGRDVTLAEFWGYWLKQNDRAASENTVKVYRWIEEKVLSSLGSRPVRLLRTDDIEAFLGRLLDSGLSANSTRLVLSGLSACLAGAVQKRVVVENVASRKLLPRTILKALKPAKLPKIRAFTPEELQLLLVSIQEKPYFPLFYTISRTGLRLSEAALLEQAALDFSRRLIQVVGKGRKLRLVDMSDRLAKLLQSQVESVRTQFDPAPSWVFPNRAGRPWDRRWLWQVFEGACQLAGLGSHSPHDLRHTYASILLNRGESVRYVQEQLGHQDPRLTVGTYGSWLPIRRTNAAERLEVEAEAVVTDGHSGQVKPPVSS